jgi:hypothetical protein
MSEYRQKLKDYRWNTVRKEILKRDNYTCVNCHQDSTVIHVHHTYYDLDLDPWEYDPISLITLCDNCHAEYHKTDKFLNKVLLDSINKCFFDKHGKLLLAAAFEIKAIELREENNVISNLFIEALCLAMFEPCHSLIFEHYGNVLTGAKRSDMEQLYKLKYDYFLNQYNDLINQ